MAVFDLNRHQSGSVKQTRCYPCRLILLPALIGESIDPALSRHILSGHGRSAGMVQRALGSMRLPPLNSNRRIVPDGVRSSITFGLRAWVSPLRPNIGAGFGRPPRSASHAAYAAANRHGADSMRPSYRLTTHFW